jgi:hypothetical protein
MKDHYMLELSGHQAKVLNSILAMANQLMNTPPNTPVYPNLPTDGIERTLVVDEFKLLHEDVVRQLKEQDAK